MYSRYPWCDIHNETWNFTYLFSSKLTQTFFFFNVISGFHNFAYLTIINQTSFEYGVHVKIVLWMCLFSMLHRTYDICSSSWDQNLKTKFNSFLNLFNSDIATRVEFHVHVYSAIISILSAIVWITFSVYFHVTKVIPSFRSTSVHAWCSQIWIYFFNFIFLNINILRGRRKVSLIRCNSCILPK